MIWFQAAISRYIYEVDVCQGESEHTDIKELFGLGSSVI